MMLFLNLTVGAHTLHVTRLSANALSRFVQKIEPESDVNEKKDRDYKPHGIISRQQIKPPNEKFSRRSKRFTGQEEKQDVSIKQEDCKEECDSDNECKESIVKNRYYNPNAEKIADNKATDKSPDKVTAADKSKELKKLQFYGPGPKMAGFNTKEAKKSNKTRGLKFVYEFDPVSIEFALSIFKLHRDSLACRSHGRVDLINLLNP